MIVVWKLGVLQPLATTLLGVCQPPNKDFCQTVNHSEMAVTRKRKVEKWIQRCQIDRLREGYKRAFDEIRGPIAKNGFSGQNPKILGKKKRALLNSNHVPATTGQCCPKEKVPFYQIINGE